MWGIRLVRYTAEKQWFNSDKYMKATNILGIITDTRETAIINKRPKEVSQDRRDWHVLAGTKRE